MQILATMLPKVSTFMGSVAKSNIEKGRNFDPQISELISSLQYLVHSDDVLVFFEEARKIMQINPGTGGSPYGWSNFESK